MNEEQTNRLKEIIYLADKLQWILPNHTGYPLMQVSEVEKCMIAMIDDFERNRMRKWVLSDILVEGTSENK